MTEKAEVPSNSPAAFSQAAQELEEKIRSRTLRPAVVGLGYVGLPLLNEFAGAGFKPIGIDLSAEKIELLKQGVSYVGDVPAGEIAPAIASGQVTVTTDFDALKDADTVDICVPTPLRKTRDPDVSYIVAATEEIAKRLHKGQMVVLESTTYPGTTAELVLPMLSETGMKVGEDFFLAFSPERVDPGNAVYTTKNIPKVVGGITPACTHLASLLFGSVMESVVAVKSTNVAEMVKLLENTFRSVNIGLVNEIALLCDRMKIDVWEVIDAAASKPFGFMPFYPGPGLGGHCIPIDPFYLSWKAKLAGMDAKFIELAGQINASMPMHVVRKVARALNSQKKAVNGSRVLIMGVAYKADIDDLRESPALDIIRLLREEGAEITYHDPFVGAFDYEGNSYKNIDLTAETVSDNDVVVIVTAHNGVDYDMIVDKASLIVDTRNALAGIVNTKISRI
jgi:UDP-N-acetyl-D-glucosamine dehydrogenase